MSLAMTDRVSAELAIFVPPDMMQEMSRRLHAVAKCLGDTLATPAIPAELRELLREAASSPNKLLASGLANGQVMQPEDVILWPLHVLLAHAAASRTDRVGADADLWQPAVPVAAAGELIDLSCDLIDDIQDGDSDIVSRWGLGTALNVAQALQQCAYLLLADTPQSGGELCRVASGGLLRAFGGQFLDIVFEPRPDVTLDDALEMTERKSGTLIGMLYHLGASIAAMPLPEMQRSAMCAEFEAFGRALGVIFQLENDMGDASHDDKSDRRLGKKTAPLLLETRFSGDLADRPAFVLRSMHAVIALYRQRAHDVLQRIEGDFHLSTGWLEWILQ
jgi:geranylgeranyl pyrophosphate synthase